MLPFTGLIEPMRAANLFGREELYSWKLVSVDGNDVTANNGITINVSTAIDESFPCDMFFVCGASNIKDFGDEKVLLRLKRLAAQNIVMGSVSAGSFLLAKAGLLDNYRCTIHWENLPVFRELYPRANSTYGIYEFDRNRVTCSGGVAGLDMMLKIIDSKHGNNLSQQISVWYQHDRLRTSNDQQQMADRLDLIRQAPKLASAITIMQNNIEEPVSPTNIAHECSLSLRQLERLFKKHRESTPQKYYMKIRLNHARQLLINTSLSGLDIALATGFTSQSHFTKSYREIFNKTPNQDRINPE